MANLEKDSMDSKPRVQTTANNINNSISIKPSTNESQQLSTSATFSIAKPAVTTILPMTENMTETSFMLTASSSSTLSSYINKQDNDTLMMMGEKSFISDHDNNDNYDESGITKTPEFIQLTKTPGSTLKDSEKPLTSTIQSIKLEKQQPQQQQQNSTDTSESRLDETTKVVATTQSAQQASSADLSTNSQEESSKISTKKRNKVTKKSTKLDAKSKLEKSRQSARECRARKKLRYQYLEDLVCNREKAVIKLREELSMFCDLSKRIDVGSITDLDRRLIYQTKENSRSESTSLL